LGRNGGGEFMGRDSVTEQIKNTAMGGENLWRD